MTRNLYREAVALGHLVKDVVGRVYTMDGFGFPAGQARRLLLPCPHPQTHSLLSLGLTLRGSRSRPRLGLGRPVEHGGEEVAQGSHFQGARGHGRRWVDGKVPPLFLAHAAALSPPPARLTNPLLPLPFPVQADFGEGLPLGAHLAATESPTPAEAPKPHEWAGMGAKGHASAEWHNLWPVEWCVVLPKALVEHGGGVGTSRRWD